MCDESKAPGSSGRRCDACVNRDVAQALRRSGRAGLHDLCVSARDGQVQLEGELTTFYEKQLAQQIAMSIRGVDRVLNEAAVSRIGIAAATGPSRPPEPDLLSIPRRDLETVAELAECGPESGARCR